MRTLEKTGDSPTNRASVRGAAALSAMVLAALAFAAPAPQSDEIKAKVKSLLEQLENGKTDQRIVAEWELLKLGPDILPLLPIDKTAVAPIQATLKELRPRTWTAPSPEMPLADALKDLKKATGLALVDRRQNAGASHVKLGEPKNATYWEAVQALAAGSNSRLSLYQPDGQVTLVDGPTPKQPVSLHGLFRVAARRIATAFDFEDKTHTGKLVVEVAWEPRFTPYLIETGKIMLDNTEIQAGSAMFVTERNAKELEVSFTRPPRAVAAFNNIAGSFVVTMPSKTLAFEFKKPAEGKNETIDGVKLSLAGIKTGKDWWTVALIVEVPAAGPTTFESHNQWLGSNAWLSQAACQLEKGAGENKKVLRPDPLYTQTHRTSFNQLAVSYKFKPLADSTSIMEWNLSCHVPGRMVQITVPFAFTNVELP